MLLMPYRSIFGLCCSVLCLSYLSNIDRASYLGIHICTFTLCCPLDFPDRILARNQCFCIVQLRKNEGYFFFYPTLKL